MFARVQGKSLRTTPLPYCTHSHFPFERVLHPHQARMLRLQVPRFPNHLLSSCCSIARMVCSAAYLRYHLIHISDRYMRGSAVHVCISDTVLPILLKDLHRTSPFFFNCSAILLHTPGVGVCRPSGGGCIHPRGSPRSQKIRDRPSQAPLLD